MGGIQQIDERPVFLTRGIIRLGYKDEGDKGRMHNTEHFILRDAPDVAKVYGDDPKEIDIVFPGNDIDKVAFAAFQHWTGKRNSDGSMTGFLACQGNGPSLAGAPGVATWFEREYAPPADECLGPRDPATGYIQRACFGDGARGACEACKQSKEKKCSPTLLMRVVLPLVSAYETYLIVTHSWNTISNVRNQLRVLNQLGVPLTSRIFTIYKESKAARPWDAGKQREFKTSIYVMKMRENKEFMALHGTTIREALKAIASGGLGSFLPSGQMEGLPPSEIFELEAPTEVMPTKEETARQTADSLVGDPEIEDAFATLEHFRGTKFTPKAKLMAIRKKEQEPDIKKAVLAEIILQIDTEVAKQKKAETEASPAEPTPVAEEGPVEAVPVEVMLPEPPLEPGIM